MKIGVKVMLKPEVLDIQGRAVAENLERQGRHLNQCRVGKFIELDVPSNSRDEALKQAREMADYVLHNPLIENYTLEVIE
ncbi:MAG TPA: phosphoribosylformylglycinamidine synthase subunit PurS [Bdellovibrionales bacterium]|nr:phosphoribosylformylglycinamidine synthase subunit PurS [Bdellovibrionales bacterium]